MNTSENNKEELSICMACLGSKNLYDGVEDSYTKCNHCNGTGEATKADNESFLDTIINYN